MAYNSGIGNGSNLLKSSLRSKSRPEKGITKRVLQRAKQLLVTLLLVIFGMGQPAAVNAQAEAMAPLAQMGAQLAAAVIPMVIPVVVTGAIYGARAASMMPSYVKSKVASIPRPHFRRKKAADADSSAAPAEGEQVSENVSGEVVDESGSPETSVKVRTKVAAATDEESVEEAPAPRRRAPKPISQRLRDEDPQSMKDPSDWYND